VNDIFTEGAEAVRLYCEGRIPEPLRDQVRVESSARGNSITIFECRPAWRPEPGNDAWTRQEVAQFRLDLGREVWTLYCRRATGRWQRFDPAPEATQVEPLITEVEADSTGIFWG